MLTAIITICILKNIELPLMYKRLENSRLNRFVHIIKKSQHISWQLPTVFQDLQYNNFRVNMNFPLWNQQIIYDFLQTPNNDTIVVIVHHISAKLFCTKIITNFWPNTATSVTLAHTPFSTGRLEQMVEYTWVTKITAHCLLHCSIIYCYKPN